MVHNVCRCCDKGKMNYLGMSRWEEDPHLYLSTCHSGQKTQQGKRNAFSMQVWKRNAVIAKEGKSIEKKKIGLTEWGTAVKIQTLKSIRVF